MWSMCFQFSTCSSHKFKFYTELAKLFGINLERAREAKLVGLRASTSVSLKFWTKLYLKNPIYYFNYSLLKCLLLQTLYIKVISLKILLFLYKKKKKKKKTTAKPANPNPTLSLSNFTLLIFNPKKPENKTPNHTFPTSTSPCLSHTSETTPSDQSPSLSKPVSTNDIVSHPLFLSPLPLLSLNSGRPWKSQS